MYGGVVGADLVSQYHHVSSSSSAPEPHPSVLSEWASPLHAGRNNHITYRISPLATATTDMPISEIPQDVYCVHHVLCIILAQ